MNERIEKFLNENGPTYLVAKELPDGRLCWLEKFLFTTGLCYGDEQSRHGRWCYADTSGAVSAYMFWNGDGDPPGPWIKHKGATEYSNLKGIPITSQATDPDGNLAGR